MRVRLHGIGDPPVFRGIFIIAAFSNIGTTVPMYLGVAAALNMHRDLRLKMSN